ncbi:polysaccharide deacetylase family protein [Pseudomonas gingeri]|uniref:polysaccharide deacetylase family protein n=1 Tax=Pseudomonas gingeri TaxID=117681 RepID=UPI0015A43BED|nr:polysaccharide deacetylase family protein [Pseudomonas gingeri]NWD06885.1 polysaccharide deacetylase family protein [Pseudomonas gingeri]NWE31483.1 polysaccharide deacetylase family protein [Pseudomonas gingeri]NWE57499.1 polysaccharide deacetylase family protein [Pseudomonas gingeri]NWE99949.1 polysaccharide deacetylase family protein [Pseudomonas gingeri]
MDTTNNPIAADTSAPPNPQRRTFLAQAGAGAAVLAAGSLLVAEHAAAASKNQPASVTAGASRTKGRFWPGDTRLVVSISMQFEAGGQPPKDTDSPFPRVSFPDSVPVDLATGTWFAYGYREGIPRMLDLWDRHDVKVTCHMIGDAVKRNPALARDIVARGHEASGHGPHWSSQFAMSRDEERIFLQQSASMLQEVTGQPVTGYNANWLRRGPNTLSLLQELGYVYHIDDISRDEPFIEQVNGKDFVVVPYTLRNNDILLIEGRNYSPGKFLEQVKLEFDQLYEEAGSRRRMMSISAHDRISGTPQMIRVWDEFLRYAKSHPGVAFMRKDAIAQYTLDSPLSVRESETI